MNASGISPMGWGLRSKPLDASSADPAASGGTSPAIPPVLGQLDRFGQIDRFERIQ